MSLVKYIFFFFATLLLLLGIESCSFTFPAENELEYVWTGAVTPTSFKINFKLKNSAKKVRVAISESQSMSSPTFTSYYTTDPANQNILSITAVGLKANTTYYYNIEIDNNLQIQENPIGKVKTFPDGPTFYSFVVGACAFYSEHPVYDAMKRLNPLFYINMGDLHYEDPSSADVNEHREALENAVLKKKRSGAFFKEVPIAYTWDDHDFSGNGSNTYSIGKKAARLAYQQVVPHYPLPSGIGDVPIYQAFTAGSVRFILTDLRSEKSTVSIMGKAQKEWFKNEVLTAKTNKEIIAWVSSVPYMGTYEDTWGGFENERRELADFFLENEIENLFILCGDAHMIAIDNGDNSDFSSRLKKSKYKYPVFHAAALNRTGSNKGGKYSHGAYPNPSPATGQFGYITVKDDGRSSVCIEFKGYRVEPASGTTQVITSYEFCRESKQAAQFRVLPNPFRENFSLLSYNVETPQVGELKIYNLYGQLMFSKAITLEAGKSVFDINTEGLLKPGVYLLNVEYGKNRYSTRILITN